MAFLVKNDLARAVKLSYKSDLVLALEFRPQMNSESLFVIGCYVPPENSKYYDSDIWERLKNLMNEYSYRGKVLLIGDFSARTEHMQAYSLGKTNRANQDIEKNRHGVLLADLCDSTKSIILNGITGGDMLGNYTYCSTIGRSTIDYAIIPASDVASIEDFFVNPQNFLSRHCPITVKLKGQKGICHPVPSQQSIREVISIPPQWNKQSEEQYLKHLQSEHSSIFFTELQSA